MSTKKTRRLRKINLPSVSEFRRKVYAYYRTHGRHDLLWRKTHDPYRILVSEVMLQQTQVPRVIEKYKEFLKRFPTVRALAKARLAEVLKIWSGLGYNRRAKYLHDAAKQVVADYRGNIKEALAHPLPGVGPYTFAAVRVFAYNETHTMIETNIRAAFIHFFYASVLRKTSIADRELIPIIEKAAEGQDPRTWHWALMDYGAYLKKSGIRNNHRSAHYVKQSKFEGSLRQVRGAILRELHSSQLAEKALMKMIMKQNPTIYGRKEIMIYQNKLNQALMGLERDGLLVKEKGSWRIA